MVAVAVFFLVASLLIWTINLRVLNAKTLSGALKDSGTYAAVAKELPDIATKDQSAEDIAKVKPALTNAIDEQYVNAKTDALMNSFIGYIKNNGATVSIDLSDLSGRIAAQGQEPPKEIAKELKEPIDLAGKNAEAFSKIRQAYNWLKLATILGPVIFGLVLLLEWFVTDKQHRLARFGRAFATTALWSLAFWFGTHQLTQYAYEKVKAEADLTHGLSIVRTLLDAVDNLLGTTFLLFGSGCLILGVIFYILHFAIERKPVAAVVAAAESSKKTKSK